jgi:hypothetical protein
MHARAILSALITLFAGSTFAQQAASIQTPAGQPASMATTAPSPGIAATPSKTAEASSGPSMKDSETWITRKLPAMGTDSFILAKDNGPRHGNKYGIESAVLSDCVLTLHTTLQSSVDGNDLPKLIFTSTVTLKDVDVEKVLPTEAAVLKEYRQNKPSYFVPLVALPDRGEVFTSERTGPATPTTKRQVRQIIVHVSDQDKASQVASILGHAAILCGAQTKPSGNLNGEKQATQSAASSPASSTLSKMTNGEIIQMATAGLSDDVIATSIRQATSRAFDLTPAALIALKKAHVSDAVISAMQNSGTVQTSSMSDAKTQPKYDPTLAETPKPVPAPASQNSCSGVESMGIYKNEIFDRAMGGGVVEWLAKIRNNSAVTRIVVFGWRDMYGQQQRAQVQIRGGEIASPRLDMSQARMIPPVSELQLLSCE